MTSLLEVLIRVNGSGWWNEPVFEAEKVHSHRVSRLSCLSKEDNVMAGLLWTIVVVLVVLWLLGFIVMHVSSGLIHLLLIAAVIVLLYNLFMAGRTRTL